MVYSAEISRANPGYFVFLIDQSGSMNDTFGEQNITLANAAADVINKTLREIILKTTKENAIKDYFDISIIGYGFEDNIADSLLPQKIVSLSWLNDNPIRIDSRMKKESDGAGGIIEVPVSFPIWFEPVAYNGTPMDIALERAYDFVSEWVEDHMTSFPPIIINITDGESTGEKDTEPIAKKIMNLKTSDGNALLFNCHISSLEQESLMFPSNVEKLQLNEWGQKLFRMSSDLPEPMILLAQTRFESVISGSKGFAFNADLVDIVEFLEIGTRPTLGILR